MPRSHSPSGGNDSQREVRRRWPLLAVTFAVAAGYVELLRWGANTSPPAGAATATLSSTESAEANQKQLSLNALQASLESELLPSDVLDLSQAWHALRGLGPRVPMEAQKLLQQAATQSDALGGAPRWAGQEPRVALSVMLLESNAPDPAAAALLEPLPGEAEDAVTLAFRLELAALAEHPPAPSIPDPNRTAAQRRLAQLVTQGMKRLERQEAPDSYAFARLAQAVFRSAADSMTEPLMVQMRRLYGKLNAADAGDSNLLLAAARLEAVASFVWLSQRWEKTVDSRLSALLRSKRDVLAQQLEQPSRYSAAGEPPRPEIVVAAVRALRLSQALLSR